MDRHHKAMLEAWDALTEQKAQESTREQLIGLLQWNDRNGVYGDADCRAEGVEPLTHEEAVALVASQWADGHACDESRSTGRCDCWSGR